MKTKAKKILALIILATMVSMIIPITNVLAKTDDKPEFAIPINQIMKREETSELQVAVNQKLEFTKFATNLDYNENAVEITDIKEGKGLANNAKLEPKLTGEKITGFEITSTDGKAIEIDAGNFVTINVKANNDADLGKYPIAWSEARLLSDDNKNMDISTVPGSVIITEIGANTDKPEFNMIYNNKMYPGEEQTIILQASDKMEINYIETELSDNDNIEVVNVTKGKDLPEDAEINLINKTLNKIDGFSIQSQNDNVINIDPNEELARITIKTSENAMPEKARFEIKWNHIINQDWQEVISNNTIANIEIMPQVVTPTIDKAYIRIKRNNLLVGEEEQVQVVVEPEDAANEVYEIKYSSSDSNVATISEDGTVKAIAPGKATIKAIINGQFTSEAQVTVSGLPETGDISIWGFVILMFVSSVGIVTILGLKKYKNNKVIK